jgi:hypothetical protein
MATVYRSLARAVVGLVLDGSAGRLLDHVLVHASTLDHEAVDHPVKDRVVVEPVLDVLQEVGHRFRRLLLIKLEDDIAHARLQSNHAPTLLGRKVIERNSPGQQDQAQDQHSAHDILLIRPVQR